MIRVLVVDDESPARNRLKRKLASFADLEVVGEASHGREALEKISELRPDVLFLDIEMPELDGLGVAASLPEPAPLVVFVTAYDEFALKAFETSALDYLVKPVTSVRLAQTVERLRSRLADARPNLEKILERFSATKAPSRVAIRSGAKYVVVEPALVSAVLARDHYVAVLADGKEYLLEDSLENVARRFRGVEWLRVHRSAILNVEFLQELQHEGDRKYLAVLKDPARTKVPISRERLAEVKKNLGLEAI
jgi:two-component system, LytTR family, response regulator